MPEYGVECEHFTIISIDFLHIYENKFYLQGYLGSFAYKVVNKEMIDYIDDDIFDSD